MRIKFVRNLNSFVQQTGSNYDTRKVGSIVNKVRTRGDAALREFEKKFNSVDIKQLEVSRKEIEEAYREVSKEQIDAIKLAQSRLAKTELELKKQLKKIRIISGNTKIEKSFVPLDSVGCYVPGGLAKYPSSAIMSVTPAKIAGVKNIIVVTPPNKMGKIEPIVLVSADMCGANKIYKVGGAHAIAALAFGTKSIPRVDKIVGPGGSFVTAAKYLVSSVVAIDMLAGPTELAILADDTANPKLIATDLISQAEHSSDTNCCLITTSKKIADKLNREIRARISTIERRKIVETSLEKNGIILVAKSMPDAISLVNRIAAEHLEIFTKNSEQVAKKIKNAGLVLIGQNSPSAASDYLLGTNHILPTNGFGKSRGSLSVLDFVKIKTTIQSSQKALKEIDKHMRVLTKSENLPNHYVALRSRL